MTDNLKRTRQRPIIRVFVSSTFSDLKAERDADRDEDEKKKDWEREKQRLMRVKA